MLSITMLATAVLASAPLAQAIGSAIVVNSCKYPVKLCNVPSANGGFEEIDKSLQPGDSYSQQYTQLSNGNGWSIKLSPDQTLDNILQYEYTFHNDGIIWYDLSDVNGNPWNGNWEISAKGAGCTPKQQAYRYSTDDAYGMQSCASDATITVTLCSGDASNDGAASSLSSSVASTAASPTVVSSTYVAPTTAAPTTTSPAAPTTTSPAAPTTTSPAAPVVPATTPSSSTPATTSVPATSYSHAHHTRPGAGKVADTPTTLSTVAATTTSADNVVVVTEVETAYVTATAYARRDVRPAHRHAHPHRRV